MVNVEPYDEEAEWYPIVEQLIGRGLKPYIVSLHSSKAVTAVNVEFITGNSTALSVVMGGSSSKLDIISASTDDKSAIGGDTRAVDIWGINDSDNLVREIVSTSGTTVSSATHTYKELNDFAGALYGNTSAGTHDAKGNIDIGQVGKVTNELFRIAADSNTILTSRIWIPKNWKVRILHASIGAGDNSSGRSSGVLMFPQWYDAEHMNEDGSRETQAFFHETSTMDEKLWDKQYGSSNTMGKLTFFGQRINVSDTWNLHVEVVIWATHSLVSGQTKGIAGLG